MVPIPLPGLHAAFWVQRTEGPETGSWVVLELEEAAR
jgi:hypothetical protein